MALTRVSRHIIDEPLELQNINATGIGTFANLRVTGDLQVDGTTTTLDTVVTEVDKLEVLANNSTVAVAVTQSGSGDAAIFMGGNVGINKANPGQLLTVGAITGGADGTLSVKTNSNKHAIAIEKNSGNENYQLGVNSDGDLGFYNSGSTIPTVTFSDTNRVGIGTDNPGQELHVQAATGLESDIRISGNGGASSYLDLFHNATNCGIWNAGNTDLLLGTSGTERLRITSDGKVRVPDNGKFVAGSGDDLQIYHESASSSNFISASPNLKILTDTFRLNNAANNNNIIVADAGSGVDLYFNNSKKLETVSTGILVTGQVNASTMHLTDGNGIYIGNGNDLRFYHNGTNSYIENYTGNLYIFNASNDRDIHLSTDDGSGGVADYVHCDGSTGAVVLSHYGNVKLATTTTGVTVTGELTSDGLSMGDNESLNIGNSSDLRLYHDGTDNFFKNQGTGNTLRVFTVDGEIKLQSGASAEYDMLIANHAGSVELYHNNTKTFETTTTGAKVTGALEVTQEYPSIRPTLDLNFAATKTLDRRITFTRDSLGTYIDENGVLKYASNNTPRFDHDFDTRESLGLLIEESSTNEWSNSESIHSNNSSVTVGYTLPNGLTNPAGGSTAIKISSGSTRTWWSRGSGGFAVTSGDYWTMSWWAYSTNQSVDFGNSQYFNVANTTISQDKTVSAGQWKRCFRTVQFDASGSPQIRFMPYNSTLYADANNEVFVWGLQFEKKAFPTSYIPTYGSTATRDDDDAVIKGTNFSDIYNETEGTIFAEFNTKVNSGTTSKWAVSLRDPANNNNYIAVKTYGAHLNALQVKSGGSTAASLSVDNSIVIDQFRRVATSFKVNDFDAADGGTLLTGDTSGAMPTGITQMDIGRGWTNSDQKLEGHIKSIKYYRTKLPDAQLQGLTQQ